jgi:hypothetical protein
MPGRTAWLLEIGQRLRAEYAAVKEPVPERLVALIKQLEAAEDQDRTVELEELYVRPLGALDQDEEPASPQ